MGTGVLSPSSLTVPLGQRTASHPLPWPHICWKMPKILFIYLIYLLIPIAINCRGRVTILPVPVATINLDQLLLPLPQYSQFTRITEKPLSASWKGNSRTGERKPLLYVITTPTTTSFVRGASISKSCLIGNEIRPQTHNRYLTVAKTYLPIHFLNGWGKTAGE